METQEDRKRRGRKLEAKWSNFDVVNIYWTGSDPWRAIRNKNLLHTGLSICLVHVYSKTNNLLSFCCQTTLLIKCFSARNIIFHERGYQYAFLVLTHDVTWNPLHMKFNVWRWQCRQHRALKSTELLCCLCNVHKLSHKGPLFWK